MTLLKHCWTKEEVLKIFNLEEKDYERLIKHKHLVPNSTGKKTIYFDFDKLFVVSLYVLFKDKKCLDKFYLVARQLRQPTINNKKYYRYNFLVIYKTKKVKFFNEIDYGIKLNALHIIELQPYIQNLINSLKQ